MIHNYPIHFENFDKFAMIDFSIIKIPLHIIPLFLEDESAVYSEYYTDEIKQVFLKTKIIQKSDLKFSSLKNMLNKNFNLVDLVNVESEFSVKGDTMILWPRGYKNPIRIIFWGEECESIEILNEFDFKKINETSRLIFLPEGLDLSYIKIKELGGENINFFAFTNQIISDHYIDSQIILPSLYFSDFDLLQKDISDWIKKGYKIIIDITKDKLPSAFKKFSQRLNFKYEIKNQKIEILNTDENYSIQAGLVDPLNKIVVLTEREVFGTIKIINKNYGIKNKNVSKLLEQFEGEIKIDDFVVHEDYGIAKYKGLEQQEINQEVHEYICLEYKGGDTVYVPIHQLSKITKFIGAEGSEPELSRLGSVMWSNTRKKIKAETRKLAKELIEHYAKRELSKAKPIKILKSRNYEKFSELFQYELTQDQKKALYECEQDLNSTKPMNRLLIGDVGFGKTEVLLRLAFRVVENGGQVLVLAPTTVLVSQHYKIFSERFKSFGYKVEFVSRFKKSHENKEVVRKAKEGIVDIVIGTHRLLSNDVEFKNLQLIVVDEEQKFGVKQKEKIKKLNLGAHLISVSATPIPRTLNMALSSIQNLSVITTPPPNKKNIKTIFVKNDWNKIVEAIKFEIERGGQIYFVHNFVNSIYSLELKLKKLLPSLRIKVAHGQMNPANLDKTMYEFYSGKFDLLLSTTIIENGLDIENVNTIIIDRIENLGLSQLHQLRGRVGRGDKEAYCYLFYSGQEIDEDESTTKKYIERIKTVLENQNLGAGYKIASKDLEIRGAGNILGKEQHGNINTIGYALYIQMLSQEIERLKSN